MKTDDHTTVNNGDHPSVPIEDEYKKMADSIRAKRLANSPLSSRCCIFRVPEVLRRDNSKVFEPDIVAIGPFHRKKQSLQPMENVKRWYLHTLLSRVSINMPRLIEDIKELETQARESYQGPIDVDVEENEFLEMMVIDGCFLIEFFRKAEYLDQRSPDDPLFNMACMNLYHDLLLLENQLPWFILHKLYDLTKPNDRTQEPLDRLVLKYFEPYFSRIDISNSSTHLYNRQILHVVDLIREVLVYSYRVTSIRPSHYVYKPRHIPSVTRLLDAGVKFKKRSSDSMLNIEFINGTFEVPTFLFDESTEPMFRNLIAFEQCYSDRGDKITSYAILMDNLINTGEDVEHLRDVDIIENWLSADDASKFFNGLYINTSISYFYYDELCKTVNEYYRTKWHKWGAAFVRDHFKTPWTIVSLIAATILLVLTFLQTLYTMM